MLKQPLIWLLPALASIGFFFYLNAASVENTEPDSITKRVRVAQAKSQSSERNPTFAGVVRAKNRASLAFSDGSGRMIKRPVDIGDTVNTGQVLAQLDQSAYKHAVDAARANITDIKARLAQNTRDVERVQILLEKKAATAEELELLEATAQSLRANLEAANVQLAEAERRFKETTLFAPFDGTITAVHMEPGEFVTPGMPILALSGENQFEIEIEVPESVLSGLKAGQTVSITFPHQQNRKTSGNISHIGQASQDTRLFPIVIQPNQDQQLIAGMSAEIELIIAQQEITTIPVKAVINPGGQHPLVFRVENSQVKRVSVDVGDLIDSHIAVDGDLKPGDEVVIGGHAGLVDGDMVEVVR